jgi:hypothetical protein
VDLPSTRLSSTSGRLPNARAVFGPIPRAGQSAAMGSPQPERVRKTPGILFELRPVPDRIAQLPEPFEGGVFDDGFIEVHGLAVLRLYKKSGPK